MLHIFFRFRYTVLMWGSLLVSVFNAFSAQSPWLGLLGGLGVLIGFGALVGPWFLPHAQKGAQTAVGIVAALGIWAIVGAGIYYAGPVTKPALAAMLIILAGAAQFVGRKSPVLPKEPAQKPRPVFHLAAIGAVIALAAWFSGLIGVDITDAIRSPWLHVDPRILIAFFTAAAMLAVMAAMRRTHRLTIALTGAMFFAAVSIAFLVYPTGYGFDPFIHAATVSHIAEFGTITPKPLYYIGQYALELIAVHIFSLPLDLVNRMLVPVAAAFTLTASAAASFTLFIKKRPLLATLSILLLPLAPFIATTPQALAYVFTAALILLSLPLLAGGLTPPRRTLAVLAFAALAVHPLAGIPAVIYLALVLVGTFETGYPALKKTIFAVSAGLGAIALPAVFILQASVAGLDVVFRPENIFNIDALGLTIFFDNRFSPWFDALYLIVDNMLWIVLALALAGIWFARKNNAEKTLYIPLLAALLWFVNFWVLSTTLEFDFLIEYERSNYADRLLVLTQMFLVPFAGIALAGLYTRLKSKSTGVLGALLVLFAFIVTANVYGAYPRHDNYARSAGFNVSTHDISTVHAIDKHAGDDPYVVLANQAVSAAALREFGFEQYFQDNIFYYPIPTGGKLYTLYLRMAEQEPTLGTVHDAMELTGVDRVYFAINDYWWRHEQIKERAKLDADDWFSIGNGAVTVFIYKR